MRPSTILICLTLLILSSCKKTEVYYAYNSPVYIDLKNGGQSYKAHKYAILKQHIQTKHTRFFEEYARSGSAHQKNLIALSKQYIYTTLIDTVFPFWYDTPWDYNGISQIPGKGKIACGYFVTTTLRDMGFKVERAALAQQASSKILSSICGLGKTHIIGHNNMDALETYLYTQPDGLYLMGLDNHIGYIHKKGKQLEAIHSNGVSGSMKVVKEPIRTCKLMLKSKAYYIANLTSSEYAHSNWIKRNSIKTIR